MVAGGTCSQHWGHPWEWNEKRFQESKLCLLRHPVLINSCAVGSTLHSVAETDVYTAPQCSASARAARKGLTLLSLIMLHLIAIHLISCINVISFYIGKQLRAMIEFHSISLNKHAN